MEHTDETILKERRRMDRQERERHSEKVIEEELKQSVYDGEVNIFRMPVQFTDYELLEGRAKMRLPADFTPCPEETVARVFFLGDKPQVVYANQYLEFALALNWTQQRLPEAGLFEFVSTIKYMVERVGPKCRLLAEEKQETEGGKLIILKLLANALDGVNYTVLFVTSLEGRLLLGSLAFDQRLSKRLAPLADEIVKSFRIKRQGQEE